MERDCRERERERERESEELLFTRAKARSFSLSFSLVRDFSRLSVFPNGERGKDEGIKREREREREAGFITNSNVKEKEVWPRRFRRCVGGVIIISDLL